MITLDSVAAPAAGSSYDSQTASSAPAGTSLLPLPCLAAGGDLGAVLASLEVQTGQVERSVASEDRDAQDALAASYAKREVQALHAEAGSMQSAAFWDAGTTFVQAFAGGQSTPVGSVVGGVKGLGDGFYGADEKNDEANAKGFEASSTAAHSGAEDARDAASSADQLVQSALDFYREYVATSGQTASAVLQRT